MTATNMCSNFGGKWDSPPIVVKSYVAIDQEPFLYISGHLHTMRVLLLLLLI